MLEFMAEAASEAVGIGAGAGGIGLLWILREVLARKNGNPKPGEGRTCQEHTQALASGHERTDWLKEGLTRVEKKIELILDEVRIKKGQKP